MTLRIFGCCALLLPAMMIPSPASAHSGPTVNDRPEQGATVRVSAAGGVSYVRSPGGPARRLFGERTLPVGSSIDATDGSVAVQYECGRCAPGRRIRSGVFHGGQFEVGQGHGSPVTTLTMQGSGRACDASNDPGGTRRVTRHLEGRVGNARFNVVGRYASVRGHRARWLVADYCARTFVAAARGTVTAIDRQTGRAITVGPLTATNLLRPTSDGEAAGGGCCAAALPWPTVTQDSVIEDADGNPKPVTQVEAGDQIDGEDPPGSVARVFYTASTHVQDAPMIRIETDGEVWITTSLTTLVMTPDGYVRAGDLALGQQVETGEGTQDVTLAETQSYTGTVVAVGLEGSEALVANGLVLGSLTS